MDIVESKTDLAVIDRPILLVDEESGELSLNFTNEEPLVMREKITQLKKHIESLPGAYTELPVEHIFTDGMYMRKLHIPKGSLIIGKIHKQECINIVAKGDISVLTETGFARVTAGFTVVSPAGIQKVGLAHEDTIFINVFRTDETDVERVEDVIACDTYDQLNAYLLNQGVSCLLSQ